MQKVFLVPLFVVSLFFGALPASALADRVALVVGNASYQHATQLDNPINDASLIASKLTELGFKVLLVVENGDGDAAIVGTDGRFSHHLARLETVIGTRDDVSDLSTVHAAVLPTGPIFVTDTYVTSDPTPEEIAEMAVLAAQ
ncbi:MAG: caspase family protein, partial [Roseibium sp.]|uniref:phosphate acyltransferase n=1 Tax=Roseibium sp. TaxID=1936156 RepID=UPI001B2EA844